MIYILALLLPFLAVMIKGKLGAGFALLLLQLTVVGWIPAVIIAAWLVSRAETEERHQETLDALKKGR